MNKIFHSKLVLKVSNSLIRVKSSSFFIYACDVLCIAFGVIVLLPTAAIVAVFAICSKLYSVKEAYYSLKEEHKTLVKIINAACGIFYLAFMLQGMPTLEKPFNSSSLEFVGDAFEFILWIGKRIRRWFSLSGF